MGPARRLRALRTPGDLTLGRLSVPGRPERGALLATHGNGAALHHLGWAIAVAGTFRPATAVTGRRRH